MADLDKLAADFVTGGCEPARQNRRIPNPLLIITARTGRLGPTVMAIPYAASDIAGMMLRSSRTTT